MPIATHVAAQTVSRPAPPAPWMLRLVRHPLIEGAHFGYWRWMTGCCLQNEPELPPRGPVIFAGNHGSHFDFLFLHEILYRKLKRNVRGVAWDRMADLPGARLLFHAYEGIPVGKGCGGQALRKMSWALRSGLDLWVQCEGTRHDTLGPFYPGAAIASLMTGRPIIPFSLRGVQPLFKKLPRPNRLWGRVSLRFHPLLSPQPYLDKFHDLRGAATQMTADLRARVASGIDYPDGMSLISNANEEFAGKTTGDLKASQ